MQIKIGVFLNLILSFWVCVTRLAKITQNKFAYICTISRKAWGLKLIFYLQVNAKVFYNLIVSFWVYVVRHAQNTPNSKFTISLRHLKENVKDDGFLPADKRQRFFQSDNTILGV